MDDLDHQRAVWAFGSTTPRENQKWFFDFFLGSVKTGVEPNILVRDLYASTVISFREIIHFLPAKKPKMITRLSFRYFTIVCLDSYNRPQKYSHFSRYQFEFLEVRTFSFKNDAFCRLDSCAIAEILVRRRGKPKKRLICSGEYNCISASGESQIARPARRPHRPRGARVRGGETRRRSRGSHYLP